MRFEDQFLHAAKGRHPLIYLCTPEEERVTESLKALAPKCFANGTLTTWSCNRGLEPAVDGTDSRDPAAALQQIVAKPRPGIYVMKDLADFMGDPRVVRGLREAYQAFCRNFQTVIVLVSPTGNLPTSLEKELCYMELDPPTPEEIQARVAAIQGLYHGAALPPEILSQALLALRGLTFHEIDHVMHRAFSAGASSKDKTLEEIFAEKERLAKKTGFLQFIPLRFDTSVVGGLENVKDWALKRKSLFTQEAVKAGMPVPKGILIMGVAGCGKSLLSKAIAGLWQVPLFRLDMSLIFSGAYGSPPAAFDRALRTVESIAPVILWIDEMEASLSTPKEAATPQSMCFSTFLTWMQEKPPLVFVAATANRIEMLPAEIVRKGRFDEVFFVDLPNKEERQQIFSVHLTNNAEDPKRFDLSRLAHTTEGWSGAEIQQAVIAARIAAKQAGRAMTTDDIWGQAYTMVPLSKTMSEQVKAIRDWAFTRAKPASSKRNYEGGA